MPDAAAGSPTQFPIKSFVLFVAGVILLRLLSVAGWALFPGEALILKIARVFIPLLFTAGLVALNQRMLSRDGFPPDALGLRPTRTRLGQFFAGAVAVTLIVGAIVGALWPIVPFHYERGAITASQFVWQSAEYFAGNWGEELIFRGYLLLIIARYFGLSRAIIVTSLLFGLFHLPGLSGATALKMVCTTSLGGCLYAYGYLLTGTLWTAAGLHVVGNIVLHHVYGASGQINSIFVPKFHERWPVSYDPAFLVWIAVLVPIIALAAYIERRRRKAAELPLTYPLV